MIQRDLTGQTTAWNPVTVVPVAPIYPGFVLESQNTGTAVYWDQPGQHPGSDRLGQLRDAWHLHKWRKGGSDRG